MLVMFIKKEVTLPKKAVKIMMLAGMVCSLTLPSTGTGGQVKINFHGPDGWDLRMGPFIRLDEAREKVERVERVLGGEPAKFYRQILKETGDYWSFGIFTNKKYLEWGPETRIVVEKTTGETVLSEACFFADGKEQRVLFDCRKRRVVVTPDLMPAGSYGATAMLVKFPPGSLGDRRQVKDISVKQVREEVASR